MRQLCILSFFLPALAMAEPVHIPGPQGPLEAEMSAVEGASHAVIIIPGSGPVDRDGNAPPMGLSTDSYRLLAEGLAKHDIASLRIDKRGFYGSARAIADPNDVTIEAYAEDAGNWVKYASGLAPCVWLAGHSEGGLVALVAAQDAPENLCGAIVADLEEGRPRDPASVTPVLQPLFSASLQRYMIDLFSYDPVPIARDWHGPVLIVQGDEDMQVRPGDADLLEGALPQARRVNLAGATHMLKAAVAGNPFATYADPGLPLHDKLVAAIADFVQAPENRNDR